MNESNPSLEGLSALADGELSRDELRFVLRTAAGDAQMRARWQRWHVARAALNRRGELPLAAGFADAVMRELASDPAQSRRPAWLRTAGGLAFAAGVAALALTIVAPREDAPDAVPTLARTTVLRAEDLSARLPTQPASGRELLSSPVVPIPIDPQVESYLLRHAAVPATSARTGFLPYVHVVASPTAADPRRAAKADAARQ